MTQLVLYGSTVADSTLTTANDMATASGGTETSVSCDWGNGGNWGELYSSGGTGIPSNVSIPAMPSGNGWIFYVGAGSFAMGNWAATFAHAALDATIPIDFTIRFFKYSGGVYTLIGSIAISPGTGSLTRTVYTFPATALAGVAFDTPDYLYVDLWEHDASGIAFSDTGIVYLSTSQTAGVVNDLQITTADFAAGAGSGIIDPTIFGSAVADATIPTACDVALTTGGVETSKDTAVTGGTGTFGEVYSQGNAAANGVASIPASPTGNGWVYRPGAGTFIAGNWSASITATTPNANGTWNFRVFSHIGATYTLVGTLTSAISNTVKTTYTFSAVSFPAVTLGASDYIYFDLWYNDLSGIVPSTYTIYESTTAVSGVASDMQINTANFLPASTGSTNPRWHRPRWIMRAVTGGIFTPFQAIPAWVDRAFGSNFVRPTAPVNIPHYVRRSLTSLLLNYGLNISTRFRLMSANQLKDIATRFRLAIVKDISTRFILISSSTQSVRDIATRFRLMSANQLKDVATRFRLKSADQVKDIQSRFRLMSANQLKDIVTRFRLKSADQLKDIASRFRLKSANQLRDVQSRFRLMSANQLKDVATRFRLKSADQFKDIATRFILASASQRLKDIAIRFRLKSADQLKDVVSRFRLMSANQVKDIVSRFRLKSADQLKDIATRFILASASQRIKDIASRFRLMSANQLKDITSRFRLMSANQVKDVASRFRLRSANQLKDIQSRFRVMSANQLRDISTRLRLKSANQLRDIASRFILHGVGTLSNRDIATRFVLIVPSNAIWITRDGLIRWLTRDDKAGWSTRDEKAVWDTRDDKVAWDTRDDLATWKTR